MPMAPEPRVSRIWYRPATSSSSPLAVWPSGRSDPTGPSSAPARGDGSSVGGSSGRGGSGMVSVGSESRPVEEMPADWTT
jgi:hypothetical protein